MGYLCHKKKYARDLLCRFGMHNCNVAPTPMNANEKFQLEDGTENANPSYRSWIGGLNYLTLTHLDIMYSVSVLSRYMHCPSRQHFGVAKRVLRYVAGTADYGIWYSKNVDLILYGYTDSDWAGCLDDRESTSGNVFNLGSDVISWSSKKQDVMALSSSKTEYVVVTSASCQVVWLRRLLVDIYCQQDEPTKVLCDNKATIAMTKNPAFHSRTKHIGIRYHFIRNLTAKGEIELHFCNTNDQVSDVLTKALPRAKHNYF